MGESRFIFYPNKHKICYTIQVSGIARATSAHLHEAPAAVVGPVKLTLTPPGTEPQSTNASGASASGS
jgi:hypothetical protein